MWLVGSSWKSFGGGFVVVVVVVIAFWFLFVSSFGNGLIVIPPFAPCCSIIFMRCSQILRSQANGTHFRVFDPE